MTIRLAAAIACLMILVATTTAAHAEDEAGTTYEDIAETYGHVPDLFRLFHRDDVADVWQSFRILHLNPYLETEARTRELISVAVATQGPCRPCVYFHAASAFANGASPEQIREAIGIGAATRRFGDLLMNARAETGALHDAIDLVLWGDTRTVELRGPPPGFCAFIIEWADAAYVGCD